MGKPWRNRGKKYGNPPDLPERKGNPPCIGGYIKTGIVCRDN
jgi:hypothetical protein